MEGLGAGGPRNSASVNANALEFVYDKSFVYEKELLGVAYSSYLYVKALVYTNSSASTSVGELLF